jgi:glucose dehydrogenase
MVWYYQMVHHDEWDYDINTTPAVLMDYKLGGKTVHAIDQPTKMGLNFILNRVNGKPFKKLPITETPEPQSPQAPNNSPTQPIPSGQPFAPQCATAAAWTAGGGTTTTGPDGNPIEFGCTYTPIVSSHYTQPGFHDKADYPPTSYSSQTGYVYVCDTLNRGDAYEAVPVAKTKLGPGDTGYGTEVSSVLNGDWIKGKVGQVVAINPVTNRPVWKATMPDGNGCYSGISTTAGGVLFVGTFSGELLGYNAKTGKLLWQSPQMQGSALNPPVVYQGLDGKEHVTIQAALGGLSRVDLPGNSVYSYTLPGTK